MHANIIFPKGNFPFHSDDIAHAQVLFPPRTQAIFSQTLVQKTQ
jgi:hypothetical protein